MSDVTNINRNNLFAPGADYSTLIHIDRITDNTGTKQGLVVDGGLTDDLQPTLSGYLPGSEGLKIRVFLNGSVAGYTEVEADGTWSFTPETPLIAGTENAFQVSLIDPANGNTQWLSNEYNLTTTAVNQDASAPPAAPVIDSVVDNAAGYKGFTGELKDGDLTNDPQPALSGHAEAGSTVNIYDNGNLLGSVTAADNGTWTFTPETELPDGPHNLTVTASNSAGESAATDFSIVVDTTIIKPILDSVTDDQGSAQGNVADGGLTDDSRPVLTGHAEANSRVDIHVFGPNGKELYYQSVTAGEDGTWSYQPKAFTTQGTYSFGISGVDKAGNAWYDYGDKYSIQFTGENQDDTVAPAAPTISYVFDNVGNSQGESKNDWTTDDTTPELHGKAEANSTVKIYDGSTLLGNVTANSSGDWSYTPSVRGEGKHTFTATATDEAGNVSAKSAGFVVNIDVPDTTAPAAPVITNVYDDVGARSGNVAKGGLTDDAMVKVSGTAEAGSVVTLKVTGPNGAVYTLGKATADTSGHWDYQMTSAREFGNKGNWTFSATAVDAAGNQSARSDIYVVKYVSSNQDDTTVPDAPTITSGFDSAGASTGDFKSGATTDDTTPKLSGKAEAGSTVKIYDGSTLLGNVTANSSGDWSYTPSVRGEGKHTFTATATDEAGNVSAKSAGFVVNIDVPDTTAPAAPVITNVYDDVGARSGNVAKGGLTDDAMVKVSGTAEAGSVVTLKVTGPNGAVYTLGKATADTSGHWDYQMTSAREFGNKGNWTFSATAVDAAGNQSARSDIYVVKYVSSNQDDTVAPAAPVINNYHDNVGSSQGYDNNGGATDDATPTLHGKAEAGSTVKIYDGSTLLGNVTANSSGDWSYTPSVRSEGKHTFTATATDEAGNTSGKSRGFVVNIDASFTETFNGQATTTFTNSAVYDLDYFKVSVLNKGASLFASGFKGDVSGVGSKPGSIALNISSGGKIELDMKNPVSELSYKLGDLSGGEKFTAHYYDVNGKEIAAKTYDTSSGREFNISYDAPGTQLIGSVIFEVNQGNSHLIWIDNITGTYSQQSSVASTMNSSILIDESGDVVDTAATHSLAQMNVEESVQPTAQTDLNNHTQDTLKLSLNDILSEAHDNLFIQDGKQQLAITGDAGDVVELKVEDITRDWQDAGQVTAGGVQYEVYQHADLNVELLVQQGVELQQVS